MCSNANDFELALLQPLDATGIAKMRKCTSCTEPSVVVVRRVNGYCVSCYHEACRHKFRATIGKSKKVNPGDRVLVWLWPPLGAAAAVAMLEEARHDTVHKKLQFNFEYAIVDGQQGNMHKLSQHKKNSVNLADLGEIPLELHRIAPPAATPPQRNSTLRLAYEAIEMLKAVSHFAKTNSFNKVFTCETSNDLAHQMLTSVALGRGCQLPDITGLSAERNGLTLLRPLREFSQEEIEKYLSSRDLPVPPTSKLLSGIQKLSRDFVNGLQADFPNTVPTIWRTADKISVSTESMVNCDFCGYRFRSELSVSPNQTKSWDDVRGAMDALQMSAQISTRLPIENSGNA
ncbi:cytoplasmic tRNA 2-thiolation protein 2-like, partial [Tropilaelaps mercedesae]